MDPFERDRTLIECLDQIYEFGADGLDEAGAGTFDRGPSLIESRDILRCFAEIDSPDLRVAVRRLLRTLASRITSADPTDRHPSAASRPN